MEHIDNNLLWNYIIDNIQFNDIASIKKHLEDCSICNDEYKIQLKFHKELFELNNNAPAFGFSRNVIIKIEKEIKNEKTTVFWSKFMKTAIISAIIIAIVLPLMMITSQKIEISLQLNLIRNLALILCSACFILWAFYGIDLFLKRTTTKMI